MDNYGITQEGDPSYKLRQDKLSRYLNFVNNTFIWQSCLTKTTASAFWRSSLSFPFTFALSFAFTFTFAFSFLCTTTFLYDHHRGLFCFYGTSSKTRSFQSRNRSF